MNKPTKPNITIPESFAANGVKADFDNNKILNGFDRIQPDVLAGDNLNKFIDDTYKGLNYSMVASDVLNILEDGHTLVYEDGEFKSKLVQSLYGKTTNCINELPQRIKYTLKDGIFTLKAGSVLIVPYGTEDKTSQLPIGSTFLHENFKVYDTDYTNGKFFVWAEVQNDIISGQSGASVETIQNLVVRFDVNGISWEQRTESGTSNTSTNTYTIYYNTATNLVGDANNTTTISYSETRSFVFARAVTSGNSTWTKLEHIFNGIGYIGGTVWLDKNAKGLISNWKNEDGTLKNIEFETGHILLANDVNNNTYNYVVLNFNLDTSVLNLSRSAVNMTSYDDQQNLIYRSDGLFPHSVIICILHSTSNVIDMFRAKAPLIVTDYFDYLNLYNGIFSSKGKSTISSFGMPSSKYENLTLKASKSTYIAPANGYFMLDKRATAAHQFAYFRNDTCGMLCTEYCAVHGENYAKLFIPAKKGDEVYLEYTLAGTTARFRFVYAEGEK